MESLRERIQEMEKKEIMNALRESNWVMARAARRLGITERMIGYKIKKYGILEGDEQRDTFRRDIYVEEQKL